MKLTNKNLIIIPTSDPYTDKYKTTAISEYRVVDTEENSDIKVGTELFALKEKVRPIGNNQYIVNESDIIGYV